MSVAEVEAWLTSAVEDKVVVKALTLAASLRRVRTARKLLVITSLNVTENLREKLKMAFDLVLVLEPTSPCFEDHAKIQGLSLRLFKKCVYLSPSMLVVKNCDKIFRKYGTFAASYNDLNDEIDTSIFLFSPNKIEVGALGKDGCQQDSSEDLSKYFNAWLKTNIQEVEELDEQYNFKIDLSGNNALGLDSKVSIFNFHNVHPFDFSELEHLSGIEIGALEKFAANECWKIFREDVESPGISSLAIAEYQTEPIAIIGMSLRLPGANNIDEFWSLLAEGRDALGTLPTHRWTKENSYFHCYDRKVEGGFLDLPLGEFDFKFFGLSPKETEFLDPQQRLLMEVTWEALEDAMINPSKLKGSRTGIFVGSWVQDYRDMLWHSTEFNFFRTYMGSSIATTAARLSHFLGTTGPSIGTESACSSAIAAVDLACKSLRNGSSSLALAAGVNVLLHPFETSLMDYVLSPDCRCKTFDASANGYARAEGCSVLLLKRLSDAVKDEDNIWGLIRGTALTQEGVSKSLGTPTVHCESLAMKLALRDGGVDPKDVEYIEAHGTGTAVGDPMEIEAIAEVYSKDRTEPLFIGSVKTNIGHTESVSGIAGIIKVLLSMKNEVIPKHLNLNSLNPKIRLDVIPARIPVMPVAWPKKDGNRRLAGVSSFGISGTDGHAIIEDAPHNILKSPRMEFNLERPLHIMKLSTKSPEAMDDLVHKYLTIFNDYIEKNEDSGRDFANLAYSANVGRATFNHRAVITAKNFTQAVNILREKSFKKSDVQPSTGNLCFLFTGQGSQYPEMGKKLYETSPLFQNYFDKCDQVLQERLNISIKDTLFNDGEELNRTLYSQTSIFVVEFCLLKLWKSWGVNPDYVLGHSLGEFAAAVAGGALDLEDALMLVAERSRLIDQLPRGKMLVIQADKRAVDEAISAFQEIQPEFWCDYAAFNSPQQTVIAGNSEMMEEFSKFCGRKSMKTIVLAATHAFHSRHMDPMLEEYRRIVITVKRLKPENKDPFPKFISGMEGKLVDANSIDTDYWVRHTRDKVRYMEACKAAVQEGCTFFLELGPHPVLSALTMMNCGGHQITCFPSIRRKEDNWETMLDTLTKLYLSTWKGEIDWKGFDRLYTRHAVRTPFYPFNRKSIWTKVRSEYPKIHPLLGSLMQSASTDTIFQSSLTLKNTKFLKDHLIGSTVIFPGAGFLEMCLAGGHATVQGITEDLAKPRRPILLQSLKIVSPLALDESGVCTLQSVVALQEGGEEEEIGYSIGVHRLSESGKWTRHATARFLPMTMTMLASTSTYVTEKIDINMIQSTWKRLDTRDFYDKLPEAGLRFGSQFQSMEMGWQSEKGILVRVKVPQDYRVYLIHPIAADAMIQALMLWTSKDNMTKTKLQLPVQIREFVWAKEPETTMQYLYCANDVADNVPFCILMEGTAALLAYMKGVDFMETTVKIFEGSIMQQASTLPKIWKDVWRNTQGPMQGYLMHDYDTLLADMDMGGGYGDDPNFNDITNDELSFYKNLVKLTRLSILKALYALGWKPKRNENFSVEDLTQSLNIKRNFQDYLNFFLRSMTKEDCQYLTEINDDDDDDEAKFEFAKAPPTMQEVEDSLHSLSSNSASTREEWRLIMELNRSLSQILTGEVIPESILYPEDGAKPNALKFYEQLSNIPAVPKVTKHFKNAESSYLLNNKSKASYCRPIYRVLEVGAGAGISSKRYLMEVIPRSESTEIEYFFTDANLAFLNSDIEKEFQVTLVFKKFDMDKDPLEQGLCPGYFDLLMATKVLHFANDIKKTMKRLRSLLKPGGLIVVNETMCTEERDTFVYGLLNAYWKFEDRKFRKRHPTLSPEMWSESLTEAGFCGITVTPLYNCIDAVITACATPGENNFLAYLSPSKHSWIIFGGNDDLSNGLHQKLLDVNRKCGIIPKPQEFTEKSMETYMRNGMSLASGGCEIEGVVYLWSLSPESRDQATVSLPFVTLMKLISGMKNPPRTFAVMRGVCAIEGFDVIDPSPGTLVGFCKSLANENPDMSATYLDLDPERSAIDQIDEIFMNLWVEHKQGAAFRDGFRLSPKLVAAQIAGNEPLPIPNGCDRIQLILPKTRLISDLEFAYLEPYNLQGNEVEVQVKAMALNFRDVFAVIKPIPAFEEINSVGIDFAGVISKTGKDVTGYKVGDRVFGMAKNISLPSHYKTSVIGVHHIADYMTFAEAATIPTAYCTVLLSLIRVAKIKEGETVLVHTASGGVGLAAIQICRFIGVNFVATAGSNRKRKYLRSLGIQHVFHSRTTDFKNDILTVTGGRGVDIVLNSLTGPGFKEASLDVLAENGRFIEMSKLNVWGKDDVRRLRSDVFYEIIDLTAAKDEELSDLLEFWKDILSPLPYEFFDALNIRGALNYLQKAKHIGKIVCIMPEMKLEKSELLVKTPLFNNDSTYLVTGGLGGVGFEVVKWMLTKGAKHIAIVSRSAPKLEVASQILDWNKNGYHVRPFSVDVGNYDNLKALLEDLRKPELGFPPLRGIMHAAGVLQDATLENQSWEKFTQTYNPKVNGSWNLHDLTKNYLLEHFALFSSIAATFGNPGQTNHSASNSFEDSLAAYRKSSGLPATCVNWGNWGEVGVATEIDFPGIRPIPTAQGLMALESFLRTQTSHVSVLNVDSFTLLQKLFSQVNHYLDDSGLLMRDIKTNTSLILNSDEFWNEVNSIGNRQGKVECFKKLVKTVLRGILKMDRSEPIDEQSDFQALGIDSLMILEMRNGLQNILGVKITLSASQLKECSTTEVLANTFVNIVEDEHVDVDDHTFHSREELLRLIRDDSNLLPENLTVGSQKEKPIDHVETVLLTGVTGNFGPYLLEDLIRRTQVKIVYCLIRATRKQSGMERLKEKLEALQLAGTMDISKLKVIEGDITSPQFGLDEDTYFNLCGKVDAIVHSAVKSDHTAKYWKCPETNRSHMRTVNVLGTVRLLEFAAKRRLKHFFHASTMLALTCTGKEGQFTEAWQDVSAFDNFELLDFGYVISKHISEQLVYRALIKGIPCKAFRLPVISGESKTGRLNYQQNHAMLRWLSCMKIEAIHDLRTPFTIIAVDHCAKITLDIFFNHEAPMDIYNIVQESLEVEQVLIEVALSFGIKLERVTYKMFLEKLKAAGESLPLAPFLKEYFKYESEFTSMIENPSVLLLKKFSDEGPNILNTSKLVKYAPEYDKLVERACEILKRDLTYLKNDGVFIKYGI